MHHMARGYVIAVLYAYFTIENPGWGYKINAIFDCEGYQIEVGIIFEEKIISMISFRIEGICSQPTLISVLHVESKLQKAIYNSVIMRVENIYG